MRNRYLILVMIIIVVMLLSLSVFVMGRLTSDTVSSQYAASRNSQTNFSLETRRTILAKTNDTRLLLHVLQNRRIDENDRVFATRRLGIEFSDKSLVPPLKKILRNNRESTDVRYAVLTALSRIEDDSVIPLLIEALHNFDSTIRFRAIDQLRKLIGKDFGFDSDGPVSQRREAVSKWKKWWKENKGEFKIDRTKALVEN